MNNSHVTIENVVSERRGAEEAKLVRIVEALQGIQSTKEWRTLKAEIFDDFVSYLEKDIRNEAKSENPNPQKLNRLAGKLEWAERFSDLSKLEISYKNQLINIRKQYAKED